MRLRSLLRMRAKQFDANEVVDAVRRVVPHAAGHHDASLGPAEIEAIHNSPPTEYNQVAALKRRLSSLMGRHAIPVCSGTAALHLALLGSGVKPGDLVLLPSMTFAAGVAAIKLAGASPVFLDSVLSNFGVSAHKMHVFLDSHCIKTAYGHSVLKKTNQRIAALIAVHVFGMPCEFNLCTSICREWGVPIVEDAAEALGSLYLGQQCGSLGDIAVLSFNNNKIVTGGGGGAVLAREESVANHIADLATTCRLSHPWEIAHDDIGFNYRMPNPVAGVICAQLERLPRFLKAKRALADAYEGSMCAVSGVQFVVDRQSRAYRNNWLNCITIDPQWRNGRNEVLAALHDAGLKARAAFTPLHTLPHLRGCIAHNPLVAEDIHRRVICLPSGVALGERFL